MRAKPSIDVEQVRAMKAQGVGPAAIAKALKIGRASVYRALEGAGSWRTPEHFPHQYPAESRSRRALANEARGDTAFAGVTPYPSNL